MIRIADMATCIVTMPTAYGGYGCKHAGNSQNSHLLHNFIHVIPKHRETTASACDCSTCRTQTAFSVTACNMRSEWSASGPTRQQRCSACYATYVDHAQTSCAMRTAHCLRHRSRRLRQCGCEHHHPSRTCTNVIKVSAIIKSNLLR